MIDIRPSYEWQKYIKFTDKCIQSKSVNKYTLSNFFLHPTRPIIQTNKILKKLKNPSLLYKIKLRSKFYISLVITLTNIFKNNNDKIIIDNKNGIYKKSYDVIFITHLVNNEQFKSSTDHYFGDLINYSTKKNISVLLIFIPHIKLNKTDFIKYLSKEKKYDSFVLDVSLIESKKKYKAIISLLKERQKYLNLSKTFKGYNSNLALYTAESFLSKNNFLNLIYGLQIGDIVKNTNSNNIVTTYEGHSWERLFYCLSRENNSSINCIGFQHTIIFKYQHSLTRVLKKEWNPNYILSSGEFTTDYLKHKISKQISIKTLGSPKSKSERIKNININNRILFIPSGEEKETDFFSKFAFKFAKEYPEYEILIRFHPIINRDKFVKKFSKINNFKISKSNIELDSSESRYVIYSTSTAVFESIKLGCIPIRLNWNSINDLSDPLWQLQSNLVEKVDSKYELYKTICKDKYIDENEIALNEKFMKLNQNLDKLRIKLKKSVFYNIVKK